MSCLLRTTACLVITLLVQVTADGIVVDFDLLESHSSDPPNVPSLTEAIAFMEQEITRNGITVRQYPQQAVGHCKTVSTASSGVTVRQYPQQAVGSLLDSIHSKQWGH